MIATAPAPYSISAAPAVYTRTAATAKQAARPLPVKAPDLTPAQRLTRDVDNASGLRARQAESQSHLYHIVGYDPDTDTVYLQQNTVKANPVYAVCRKTLTCTCPDANTHLAKINARLVQADKCPCLKCKHVQIVNLWELASDPDLGGDGSFEKLLAEHGLAFRMLNKEMAILLAIDRAFGGCDEERFEG